MTTLVLRERLVQYVLSTNDKKVKALYSLLEDSIDDKYDSKIWTKEFVKELDKANEEVENGLYITKEKLFKKINLLEKKINEKK